MPQPSDTGTRRHALLGLAALGLAGVALGRMLHDRGALPDMTAISSAPGFRRLPTQSGLSGVGLLSLGVDDAQGPRPRLLPVADLERALFSVSTRGVPVAVFSDYFCPVCPDVGPLVRRVDREMSVRWHDWPIFGRRSDFVARLSVAASELVAPDVVHDALMSLKPRPSDAGLDAAADVLGLEAPALHTALRSPRVDAQLQRSAALAYQLGLQGTPAFVIGRTVISGLPDVRLFRRVLDAEAERPPALASRAG